MTSQPRIFTPVVAEEVDFVLGVDCFAAFFLVMVEWRDVYRREWVRKGVQAEGASVNNLGGSKTSIFAQLDRNSKPFFG